MSGLIFKELSLDRKFLLILPGAMSKTPYNNDSAYAYLNVQ